MTDDGVILALGIAGVLAAGASVRRLRGSGARSEDEDARIRTLVCDILAGEGLFRVSEQNLRLAWELHAWPLDELERAAADAGYRRKLMLLRTLTAKLRLEEGSAEAERLTTCLSTLSNETLSSLAGR